MRTTTLLFASALLATACSSASKEPAGVEPMVPGVETARSALQRNRAPAVAPATVSRAVSDNNAFNADLYGRLLARAPAGTNAFFSGYSVSSAFAMLQAGARGQTAKDIAAGIHFSLPDDELHPAMNRIALELESRAVAGGAGSDGNGFRLAMNNSFWGEKTTTWQAAYLDTLAVHYDAGINLVSFLGDSEGARQKINAWTEQKTEKRIKELLPPSSIGSDTRFVLVNTVYFNAAWLEEFTPTEMDFASAPESSAKVPAIRLTSSELKHGERDGTEVVAIPYEGGKLEMVVLVPQSLAALEDGLDGTKLDALLDLPVRAPVALTMPKLKIEGATVSLKDELSAMGLGSIFRGGDFSGITETASLAISDVFHQAFVKINEKGTEAAAATAIVGRATSAGPQARVVAVNRPYLFVVRDVPTKQVLFTGRVVAPSYSQ